MQLTMILALLGAGLLSIFIAPSKPGQKHGQQMAAYFLENNPSGNFIISLKANGSELSDPVRTSTGGVGSISLDETGFPLAYRQWWFQHPLDV